MKHAPEIELELFAHRFSAIAAEMGEMLQRTALSTNVRDRLDFSCALLDPDGQLVVNAPHIPVHLGALGLCVRSVRDALEGAGERFRPGDTVVTNHPAFGGSHLPDVTLITPVFDASERTESRDGEERGDRERDSEPRGGGPPSLLGWVASRSHHAEIGGSRPGSMPPDATCLAQEGVVIEPRFLARAGEVDWPAMRALLADGAYPSRSPSENLADLDAALAANHRGASGLQALAEQHGAERVVRTMALLQARAADRMARAFGRWLAESRGRSSAEGETDEAGASSSASSSSAARAVFQAVEKLDDGTPLAVRIELWQADAPPEGETDSQARPGEEPGARRRADRDRRGRARIDFTGSGAVHGGNLNANPAIVRGAVLYVLRLLIDEELPLAEGLLGPVELVIPEGTLLAPDFSGDPRTAPAVVGGNVETSQRLVDALLRALGLAAGSQGTMNNVLFGNARFGYYETVCGGAGAGPEGPGAHAVHTHMTNTRITDPEILEHRYPVRLERFAVRAGSGGAGRHAGGDGAVRRIRFLEPVELSILSQHRVERPYGLDGGGAGQPGRQWLERADGRVEPLDGIDRADLGPGDELVLETPGGGGWGRATRPSGAE